MPEAELTDEDLAQARKNAEKCRGFFPNAPRPIARRFLQQIERIEAARAKAKESTPPKDGENNEGGK